MPKEEFHRQCILVKAPDITTTAWLPEKFAKVGKWVVIEKDDGWEAGWKVIEVGAKLETKAMLERSQDYKKTREASDV